MLRASLLLRLALNFTSFCFSLLRAWDYRLAPLDPARYELLILPKCSTFQSMSVPGSDPWKTTSEHQGSHAAPFSSSASCYSGSQLRGHGMVLHICENPSMLWVLCLEPLLSKPRDQTQMYCNHPGAAVETMVRPKVNKGCFSLISNCRYYMRNCADTYRSHLSLSPG